MRFLKKLMGIILMVIAPVIIYFLVMGAIDNIDAAGKKDINKPVPWIIIITIFTPVATGLMIFGFYAFKGEYDKVPRRSEDLI